jgi:hypothetical protein
VIKNWPNNVHVGFDGACKLMNMIDFFTLKSIKIEDNNKFIER